MVAHADRQVGVERTSTGLRQGQLRARPDRPFARHVVTEEQR